MWIGWFVYGDGQVKNYAPPLFLALIGQYTEIPLGLWDDGIFWGFSNGIIVGKILFIVLLLSTSYLLWDGFTSGSVWVRGGRRIFEFGKWAHKKNRDQEPGCYWIAMLFYGGSALFSLYALFFIQ